MTPDFSVALAPALVGAAAAATAAGLVAAIRPASRSLGLVADALCLLATVGALAGWVIRWVAAGHLPLFGTYESSWSLAVAVTASGLLARWRSPSGRSVWAVTAAVTAALVAHGRAFDPAAYPLTISERSLFVDLHAVLAWAAFGCLAANAGFALVWLARRREPAPGEGSGALAFTLSLGFVLHTGMMASGSFYKFLLFGTAWSFDPIETLGFAAWTAYGTLLHMHLFARWEGLRLAAWCLGLFLLLVVSYRGIVYFPSFATYHILDMDLRMHLPR